MIHKDIEGKEIKIGQFAVVAIHNILITGKVSAITPKTVRIKPSANSNHERTCISPSYNLYVIE